MRGFVYILINQTMPDLVKIGKTTRLSENRAKEIENEFKSVTGLPFRFHVAYDWEVYDCHKAEKIIHDELKHLKADKEWFYLGLKDAIKSIEKIIGNQKLSYTEYKIIRAEECLKEAQKQEEYIDDNYDEISLENLDEIRVKIKLLYKESYLLNPIFESELGCLWHYEYDTIGQKEELWEKGLEFTERANWNKKAVEFLLYIAKYKIPYSYGHISQYSEKYYFEHIDLQPKLSVYFSDWEILAWWIEYQTKLFYYLENNSPNNPIEFTNQFLKSIIDNYNKLFIINELDEKERFLKARDRGKTIFRAFEKVHTSPFRKKLLRIALKDYDFVIEQRKNGCYEYPCLDDLFHERHVLNEAIGYYLEALHDFNEYVRLSGLKEEEDRFGDNYVWDRRYKITPLILLDKTCEEVLSLIESQQIDVKYLSSYSLSIGEADWQAQIKNYEREKEYNLQSFEYNDTIEKLIKYFENIGP